MTPLELLRLQLEGSLDARGRVAGWFGAVLVRSIDGEEASWIGADNDDVRAALVAARAGALPLRGGPSFIIGDDVRFAARARIVCSGGAGADELRALNPGNWQALEWDELLDGKLGPWTMAVDGGRVVSICHTPGPMSARAAECGVWTHADHRGRGHAAAVTSAWAELLRPSGRRLFYATDDENVASQRVAARLGLRRIGHIWRLGRARDDEPRDLHPLSALRRR